MSKTQLKPISHRLPCRCGSGKSVSCWPASPVIPRATTTWRIFVAPVDADGRIEPKLWQAHRDRHGASRAVTSGTRRKTRQRSPRLQPGQAAAGGFTQVKAKPICLDWSRILNSPTSVSSSANMSSSTHERQDTHTYRVTTVSHSQAQARSPTASTTSTARLARGRLRWIKSRCLPDAPDAVWKRESRMAFKDSPVTLTSYPDPTSRSRCSMMRLRSPPRSALTLPRFPARCTFRYPATSSQARLPTFPVSLRAKALFVRTVHRFAESAADIRYRALWLGKLDQATTSGLVALMEKNKLKRLPVMRGETLVGIVSRL